MGNEYSNWALVSFLSVQYMIDGFGVKLYFFRVSKAMWNMLMYGNMRELLYGTQKI